MTLTTNVNIRTLKNPIGNQIWFISQLNVDYLVFMNNLIEFKFGATAWALEDKNIHSISNLKKHNIFTLIILSIYHYHCGL